MCTGPTSQHNYSSIWYFIFVLTVMVHFSSSSQGSMLVKQWVQVTVENLKPIGLAVSESCCLIGLFELIKDIKKAFHQIMPLIYCFYQIIPSVPLQNLFPHFTICLNHRPLQADSGRPLCLYIIRHVGSKNDMKTNSNKLNLSENHAASRFKSACISFFANSLMQADSEFNLHGQTLMHPKMIILDANELKQVYFWFV